ncbi:MAG: hypothetical protein Q9227_007756 [Pyrenula ochraceoflavens]
MATRQQALETKKADEGDKPGDPTNLDHDFIDKVNPPKQNKSDITPDSTTLWTSYSIMGMNNSEWKEVSRSPSLRKVSWAGNNCKASVKASGNYILNMTGSGKWSFSEDREGPASLMIKRDGDILKESSWAGNRTVELSSAGAVAISGEGDGAVKISCDLRSQKIEIIADRISKASFEGRGQSTVRFEGGKKPRQPQRKAKTYKEPWSRPTVTRRQSFGEDPRVSSNKDIQKLRRKSLFTEPDCEVPSEGLLACREYIQGLHVDAIQGQEDPQKVQAIIQSDNVKIDVFGNEIVHVFTTDTLIEMLDTFADLIEKGQKPILFSDAEGERLGSKQFDFSFESEADHGNFKVGMPSFMTTIQLHFADFTKVYIIYVYRLNYSAFHTPGTKGGLTLRAILQDPKIIKVFFDVRQDSRGLWYEYGVTLNKVHDLQLLEHWYSEPDSRVKKGLDRLVQESPGQITQQQLEQWRHDKKAGGKFPGREGGPSDWRDWYRVPLEHPTDVYSAQDVSVLPFLYESYKDAADIPEIQEATDQRVNEARADRKGKGKKRDLFVSPFAARATRDSDKSQSKALPEA